MDLNKLWGFRAGAFWRTVIPQMRYVLGSGLQLFIVATVIGFAFWYARWLQTAPHDYPVQAAALAVLLPVLTFSPVRTFLQEADLVYLLPLEHRMNRYFLKPWIFAALIQSGAALIALLVLFPLYTHVWGQYATGYADMAVPVVILKLLNLYGSWKEIGLVDRRQTAVLRVIRWSMTALPVYALFTLGYDRAMWFAALVFVTYWAIWRLPQTYSVNWEMLIETERRHLNMFNRFLSWFVDTPALPTRINKRSYAANLAERIRFSRDNSYTYLFYKTFVRTELYGITVRLTIIGIVLQLLFASDWVKLAVYGVVLLMIGVQLTGLQQAHKHTFWLRLYPLDARRRIAAVRYIYIRVHVLVGFLLAIPLVWTMDSRTLAAAAAVIGVCSGVVYSGIRMRDKKQS